MIADSVNPGRGQGMDLENFGNHLKEVFFGFSTEIPEATRIVYGQFWRCSGSVESKGSTDILRDRSRRSWPFWLTSKSVKRKIYKSMHTLTPWSSRIKVPKSILFQFFTVLRFGWPANQFADEPFYADDSAWIEITEWHKRSKLANSGIRNGIETRDHEMHSPKKIAVNNLPNNTDFWRLVEKLNVPGL